MATEDARVAKLLAEHYQAGVKEERERVNKIINHLENKEIEQDKLLKKEHNILIWAGDLKLLLNDASRGKSE